MGRRRNGPELEMLSLTVTGFRHRFSFADCHRFSRFSRRTSTENGGARICDYPFGEHFVVVNPGPCETRMPGFHASFKREEKVWVIPRNCARYHIFSTGCPVRLRVRNHDGEPVGGVRLMVSSKRNDLVTDEYGRVAFTLPLKSNVSVRGEISGEAGETRLECRDLPHDIETILNLSVLPGTRDP